MRLRYRYEAIAHHIAAQIDAGFYREGNKLPSVRTLIATNGVSMTTASRVLVELESMGYAESRERSGFYVRRRRAEVPEYTAPRPTETSGAPAQVNLTQMISKMFKASADPSLLGLGAAELADDLLPHKDLGAAMRTALRLNGAQAAAYCSPTGHAQLRRQIALMMGYRGVVVSPEDVIITAGESDAMGSALRTVTRPGDTVIVESPTFFGLLQWIETVGLKAVEVATHPHHGIEIDEVERVLASTEIAAIALNPTFHNPFGSAMLPERMRALVDLAINYDCPIIEDDVYGELHFGSQPRRPLKSFDRNGSVIYCSSFSKTLAPGFRVGWCIPGRYKEPLTANRPTQNFGTCTLSQMALAQYLHGRRYGRHLDTLRQLFSRQSETIRTLVLEAFPPGTRISAPEGGYVYWVELPPPIDSMALHQEALAHGISIAPGPLFSPSGRFSNAFRLSVGRSLNQTVENGIRLLGKLVYAEILSISGPKDGNILDAPPLCENANILRADDVCLEMIASQGLV